MMNQGSWIRASPQSTPPSQPTNTASPPVILHADDDLIRAFRYEDCSWDEVVSAMAAARAESDKRNRKLPVRIYKNRAVVTTLESLSDMIPDQNGLSVLRGGLKTIFKLVLKHLDNQDQILRTFENIPETFSQAVEMIRIHSEDDVLRKLVDSLFKTLVQEIPKLVRALQNHPSGSGSWPIRILRMHPEQQALLITSTADSVTKASEDVSRRVQVLRDQKTVETWRETKAVGEVVNSGIESIKAHQAHTEQERVRREEQTTLHLDEHFEVLSKDFHGKIQDLQTSVQMDLRELQTQLRALTKTSKAIQCPAIEQTQALQEQAAGINYGHLFVLLELPDPSFLLDNIEQVLRASRSFHSEGLDRARWLLVTDRFRNWVQNPGVGSDLILVHGQLGEITQGKISALSTMVALFASMKTVSEVVVVHYFCGLHSRSDDPLGGPRGLIQSLIIQLILYLGQQNGGRTTFPTLSDFYLFQYRQQDLAALCLLLRQLLDHLPVGATVYCVIDSICQFEASSGSWRIDLYETVEFLQHLVREYNFNEDGLNRSGPVLKVLMTAVNKSIESSQQVDHSNQIWLSTGNTLSSSISQNSFEEAINRALMFDPR